MFVRNIITNILLKNLTLIVHKAVKPNRSVLSSFGIKTKEEDLDLPSLYCIPKLHKNPYKQWFIAGSAKCSTKTLSQILTSLLSAVKEGLQKYYDTVYSHNGVAQMLILKHSKRLLKNFESNLLQLLQVLNLMICQHYIQPVHTQN